MRKHKHHKIPKSRGGSEDWWNFEEKSAYDHAYDHALDFVLFDSAPVFDCRHEAWPLLPEDLRQLVREKLSNLMRDRFKGQKGKNHPQHGRRGELSHSFGRERSIETRQRLSLALKGKPKSEEHRKNMMGSPRPKSQEQRDKMSKALKGRTLSDSHKQKISESLAGNQRWLGRKHSEETKRKMSEAAKKRHANKENHG